MKELVSIIVPVYRAAAYIAETIAMVEAQCSGLPNLVSDVITGDVDVTPLVHRMSLERPATEWAERILALAEEERKAADERLFAEKGFDIREMVRRYEELA